MTEPYCDFQVGDKVVFLGTIQICPPPNSAPQMGTVYTVREVLIDPDLKTVCVRLNEIVNPTLDTHIGPWELAFTASYFRRVIDTTKTVEALRQVVIDEFQRDQVPA